MLLVGRNGFNKFQLVDIKHTSLPSTPPGSSARFAYVQGMLSSRHTTRGRCKRAGLSFPKINKAKKDIVVYYGEQARELSALWPTCHSPQCISKVLSHCMFGQV